jgi:hypothetical protein
MVGLAGRCGYQKALVAIANKHARMIWAMLARDERMTHRLGSDIGELASR